MCQMMMLQEEINKNQKGGNNNRDSGLFGLDVPPKPEVGNPMQKIITIVTITLKLLTIARQTSEEPVSPSPRIGREVWSTDHEGSQIR